ncbi:MAG: hypothetical protein RMK89_14510, partial [Armatimonadota bacterium]|nr:hypothetical protein [Armatimonadota bacterium]MDW8144657.1 hypothetical protein [Armatimonadota bacterium]
GNLPAWHFALAEKLEGQGRFKEALQFAKGKVPANWLLETAGDLGIAFERTLDGIRLQSLFDRKANRELLAEQTLPLFTLILRHLPTKRKVQLHADRSWQKVEWQHIGDGILLRWQQPKEVAKGVEVTLRAALGENAIRWEMSVTQLPPDWSVMRVAFPQLSVADLGENAEVFFPRGP